MVYFITGRIGSGKKKLVSLLKQMNMSIAKTINDLNDTDTQACIVSPDELIHFMKENNDTVFKIIYISADDMDRKFNIVKKEQNKIKAEESFDRIDEEEDEIFNNFEKMINNVNDENMSSFAKHLAGIYRYENDFSENEITNYARFIEFESEYIKKIINIIDLLVEKEIMETDPENKNNIFIMSENNEKKSVSKEYFADIVSENEHLFYRVIKPYIMLM